MHPLRSSSKHSIVSLLVRRSRFFRFTSFSKKGTFFRTPWLQRLGLLVFPEDKPHFTTASCFSVAHSAWSFLHTSFLLLPSKKKCQGERTPHGRPQGPIPVPQTGCPPRPLHSRPYALIRSFSFVTGGHKGLPLGDLYFF